MTVICTSPSIAVLRLFMLVVHIDIGGVMLVFFGCEAGFEALEGYCAALTKHGGRRIPADGDLANRGLARKVMSRAESEI